MSINSTTYKLGYQISPIILTDGVAKNIPGGMLPLVAVTQAGSFTAGLLAGADALNLDDFYAHFEPAPGTTLINQDIGRYPYANQTIAANATVQNPKSVSLLMHCPVRGSAGYVSKTLTMLALTALLDKHNTSGGSYIVATPSYIYTGALLLRVTDVTAAGRSAQRQTTWQWDFEQPLISTAQAQQTLNALMGKMDSGVSTGTAPAWSGAATNLGSTAGNVASSVISSAKNLIGSMAQ